MNCIECNTAVGTEPGEYKMWACVCGAVYRVQGTDHTGARLWVLEKRGLPDMVERINPAPERVNHPLHYGGDTTYEAIKVIEAWQLGFCLGNAVKYIARAGKKDQKTRAEDLAKAKWYLQRELDTLAAGKC